MNLRTFEKLANSNIIGSDKDKGIKNSELLVLNGPGYVQCGFLKAFQFQLSTDVSEPFLSARGGEGVYYFFQ